jgi:hypothetical protein
MRASLNALSLASEAAAVAAAAEAAASAAAAEAAAAGYSLGRTQLPGLICTAHALAVSIPDNAALAYGLDDFGGTIWATLADWTPTANVVLVDKVASNLGHRVTLLTTGVLRLQIGNGANLTTYSFDSTAAVSTLVSDGCPAQIGYDLDRDGNILFTVNGVQLGNTVSISAASAQTATSSATTSLLSDGTNFYAGTIHAYWPLNFAMTLAERARLYLGGWGALPEYSAGRAGTNLAINTAVFTDAGGTATATALTATSMTFTGTSQYIRASQNPYFQTMGQKLRVKATVTYRSGTLPTVALYQTNVTASNTVGLAAGANTVILTPTSPYYSSAQGVNFYVFPSANFDCDISGVAVHVLGPVANLDFTRPDQHLGFQGRDYGSNRLHATLSTTSTAWSHPWFGPKVFSYTFTGYAAISTSAGTTAGPILPAGCRPVDNNVLVDTAFDGTTPTLDLGTSGSPTLVTSALSIATTGQKYQASGSSIPQSSTATTQLYFRRNVTGSPSTGALTANVIIERVQT